MAATNHDDLGIGQVLERALPYFDHIYPMVYPSHYPKGFNGYDNVNAHAYDIVKFAMDAAVRRAQATTTTVSGFAFTPIASTSPQLYSKPVYSADKIRPWLQSFDYPVTYTPAMVESQIKAANDAGLQSWAFGMRATNTMLCAEHWQNKTAERSGILSVCRRIQTK